MNNTVKFEDFKKSLLKNAGVKAEYEKLDPEYQLMREIITARKNNSVTQKMLAKMTGTSQAKISKIESGETNPTIQTVAKIALALGKKLEIKFV